MKWKKRGEILTPFPFSNQDFFPLGLEQTGAILRVSPVIVPGVCGAGGPGPNRVGSRSSETIGRSVTLLDFRLALALGLICVRPVVSVAEDEPVQTVAATGQRVGHVVVENGVFQRLAQLVDPLLILQI